MRFLHTDNTDNADKCRCLSGQIGLGDTDKTDRHLL